MEGELDHVQLPALVSVLRPFTEPDVVTAGFWVGCVATEVDFDSTLIGGPRALVDAVLADEAFEVTEADSLAYNGDEVN